MGNESGIPESWNKGGEQSEKHAMLLDSLWANCSHRDGGEEPQRQNIFEPEKSNRHISCLQPKLNVKSHMFNLNVRVCICAMKQKAQLQLPENIQHYKNVQTMTLSQNTSNEGGEC